MLLFLCSCAVLTLVCAGEVPVESRRRCDCAITWSQESLKGVQFAPEEHVPIVTTIAQAKQMCYRQWNCIGINVIPYQLIMQQVVYYKVHYYQTSFDGMEEETLPIAWKIDRSLSRCSTFSPPTTTNGHHIWYNRTFPSAMDITVNWKSRGHMLRQAPNPSCWLTPTDYFGPNGTSCLLPFCPMRFDTLHDTNLTSQLYDTFRLETFHRHPCGNFLSPIHGTCWYKTNTLLSNLAQRLGEHDLSGGECHCNFPYNSVHDVACEWNQHTDGCSSSICNKHGYCSVIQVTDTVYDSMKETELYYFLLHRTFPLRCICSSPWDTVQPNSIYQGSSYQTPYPTCDWNECGSTDGTLSCEFNQRGECQFNEIQQKWQCKCDITRLLWGEQCQYGGTLNACYEQSTTGGSYQTCEKGTCIASPADFSEALGCECYANYTGTFCNIPPCGCGEAGLCVFTDGEYSCRCARKLSDDQSSYIALASDVMCHITKCDHGTLSVWYTDEYQQSVEGECICMDGWTGYLCNRRGCPTENCLTSLDHYSVSYSVLAPYAFCDTATGSCNCNCQCDATIGLCQCIYPHGGSKLSSLRMDPITHVCVPVCASSTRMYFEDTPGIISCEIPVGYDIIETEHSRHRFHLVATELLHYIVLDFGQVDLCFPGEWAPLLQRCLCPSTFQSNMYECHACQVGYGPTGNCTILDYCKYPTKRTCLEDNTCSCSSSNGFAICTNGYGPFGTDQEACTVYNGCVYDVFFECNHGTCIENSVTHEPFCMCHAGWGPQGNCTIPKPCYLPWNARPACEQGNCIEHVSTTLPLNLNSLIKDEFTWATCVCEQGWSGELCDTKVNETLWFYDPITLKAVCKEGFYGTSCSIWSPCTDVSLCSEHGLCIPYSLQEYETNPNETRTPYRCQCEDGWGPPNKCITWNPCLYLSNNGNPHRECVWNQETKQATFQCENSWGPPPLCNVWNPCSYSQNGTCSNHGTCLLLTTTTIQCECEINWTGANCEQWDPCNSINSDLSSCLHGTCIPLPVETSGTILYTCNCWEHATFNTTLKLCICDIQKEFGKEQCIVAAVGVVTWVQEHWWVLVGSIGITTLILLILLIRKT